MSHQMTIFATKTINFWTIVIGARSSFISVQLIKPFPTSKELWYEVCIKSWGSRPAWCWRPRHSCSAWEPLGWWSLPAPPPTTSSYPSMSMETDPGITTITAVTTKIPGIRLGMSKNSAMLHNYHITCTCYQLGSYPYYPECHPPLRSLVKFLHSIKLV